MNDFFLEEDKRFDEYIAKFLTTETAHGVVKEEFRASHLRLLARLREEIRNTKGRYYVRDGVETHYISSEDLLSTLLAKPE